MEQDRMTGKTSRIILATALSLSQGKRVLIVVRNYHNAVAVANMIHRCLESIGLAHCVVRCVRDRLDFVGGGHVQVLSRESTDRLCGSSYDELHVDTELSNEQMMHIFPLIRSSMPVVVKPAEPKHGRRTLSSHSSRGSL